MVVLPSSSVNLDTLMFDTSFIIDAYILTPNTTWVGY